MLQQILDKMFVEPEILEALDEEQKQILFIKMREEQVKRWKAYEEKYEREHPIPKKRPGNSRGVQWLTGVDGEVWVWVMGEHKDDLSLEEMIEKRALEEARELAEKEMLESIQLAGFDNESQDMYPSEDENTLKQQLSRMGVQGSYSGENGRDFYYADVDPDELPEKVIKDSPKTVTPKVNVPDTGHCIIPYDSRGDAMMQNINFRNCSTSELNNECSRSFEKKSPSVPERPSGLNQLSAGRDAFKEGSVAKAGSEIPQSSGVSSPHSLQSLNNNRQTNTSSEKPPFLSPKPLINSARLPTSLLSQPSTSWANKSATLPTKLDHSALTIFPQVKLRSNTNSKLVAPGIDELSKRQSEIYEMIKEKRQKILKEAEREAERANHDWEEQERKAREAEAQIRRIAQKAREQHRQQSLRTSTSILPALKDTNAVSLREAIKNLPRPPKPKSRQAIVDWFRVEELPRGTGLDPKTNLPAPWFHGIISREQADELLQNKPSGSFLVRISERIWGYTVSYVVGDGTTKHFLIERIPEGYQFLGTNQVVHRHLFDLITYHETAPITMKGNEILKWAVGQISSPPDYAELLADSKLSLKQRTNTLPSSFYRRV